MSPSQPHQPASVRHSLSHLVHWGQSLSPAGPRTSSISHTADPSECHFRGAGQSHLLWVKNNYVQAAKYQCELVSPRCLSLKWKTPVQPGYQTARRNAVLPSPASSSSKTSNTGLIPSCLGSAVDRVGLFQGAPWSAAPVGLP